MTQQTTALTGPRAPRPLPPDRRRWLAAVVVAVVLAGGVLLLGRLAPSESVAMRWRVRWFLAVLVAAALVAYRRRHLALPLGAGYKAAALVLLLLSYA